MGEVAGPRRIRIRDQALVGEPPPAAYDDGGPLGARLHALQAATAALAQLTAVERVVAVATAAARDGLNAEVLVIALLDEDGRHLRSTALGARQRLASIPAQGPSLLAVVARSGQPLYQNSSLTEVGKPCHAATRLRSGTESIAALPLPGPHGPLGVIVIARPGQRAFSADDIAFLDVLAGLCALTVERLRLSVDRSHVRELLRRQQSALRATTTKLRVGRMRIDLELLQLEVDGRCVHLTPTEMRLLKFLAEEPGRPRTRGEILRHLWQSDFVGGERACDAHIWNLRRKIERDPSRPELVVTRRGVGYALEVD